MLQERQKHGGLAVVTVHTRIDVNPKVMLGKPVVRGTRITVELLLRKLSEGATEDDILEAYPHLSREDIRAAEAYAADVVAREDVVLSPQPSDAA